MSVKSSDSKITLVGAGLVGSLLAIFLARRGYSVEIFERRSDMRKGKAEAGRSINLAISTRGLNALAKVGLREEALKLAIPMRGRMVHLESGELSFQAYGIDDSQCINSISRAELNKLLMNAAEATAKVKINFNQRVSAYDSAARAIHISDEISKAERIVVADPLIGTDGSASVIRNELMKKPAHEFSQVYLSHGYKELHIPQGSAAQLFQIEKNALHIWPRKDFMLIALPNLDGSFTCTLFLPFEGEQSFATIKEPEAAENFFRKEFPDAFALMPNFRTDFFANPTGQMVTVKCFPWFEAAQTLLLGDASHAIVPFFGQGMNCGFEDCLKLDEFFESSHDFEKIFKDFSVSRKENTDAIADMAVENFFEMRAKVADQRFLLEKDVEKLLQKKFPKEYISRYGLVTFSLFPYALAYQAGVKQQEILKTLCENLKRAEDVDYSLAAKLIAEKLSPLWNKFHV